MRCCKFFLDPKSIFANLGFEKSLWLFLGMTSFSAKKELSSSNDNLAVSENYPLKSSKNIRFTCLSAANSLWSFDEDYCCEFKGTEAEFLFLT